MSQISANFAGEMKKLPYYLLRGFVSLLSLLPFWVLYGLADCCFVLVYYLVRYRRKIVRKNLTTSFPEMSLKDIRRTERRFYRWLCDYVVETIKLLSISDKALMKRLEIRGVEDMEECFDRGQNCAAILGHYCNWEWLTATKRAYRRYPETTVGQIYHPLYNEAFDKLFIDIRSAHGGFCIAKQDILRQLVVMRREKRHYLFGYLSDQAPRWHNIHLWLPFLNHDTPVFTGGERIMRKMDDAVFYVDMERPCRGRYIFTYRPLCAHASQEPENAITYRFFQLLEETIRREPAYYLWTHNRWKRTHEEFDRQYVIVNGKTIPRDNVDS